MPSCPTCGEEKDTEKGVKIHHYYKHGESIAREESNCDRCGKTFYYYPSEKEGVYCSECADNSWGNENLVTGSGENNPNYDSYVKDYHNCGSEVEVISSRLDKYSRIFCSTDCYGEWRSEWQKGENNPNYKHGKSDEDLYVGDWSAVRKEVLERDDRQCSRCGKGKEEIGRNPDVHHIHPVASYKEPNEAHKTENLICLCIKCHNELEGADSVEAYHIGLPSEVKNYLLEESR